MISRRDLLKILGVTAAVPMLPKVAEAAPTVGPGTALVKPRYITDLTIRELGIEIATMKVTEAEVEYLQDTVEWCSAFDVSRRVRVVPASKRTRISLRGEDLHFTDGIPVGQNVEVELRYKEGDRIFFPLAYLTLVTGAVITGKGRPVTFIYDKSCVSFIIYNDPKFQPKWVPV